MEPMRLFAMILSLVPPPASQPATRPAELKLKPGDQIVAIGDSITQAGGYLRAMDAVFAQQYPALKVPKTINAGISGQKAEDLVKRFDRDVVRRHPAIVTISIGINDVWHRLGRPADPEVLAAYSKNLDRMVKMAKDAGIQVYLLAPTVIEENPKSEGNLRLKKYVEVGKEVAKKNDCTYVDLHEMMLKAIRNWNAKHPLPRATTQPINFFTSDGVHMRAMGDAVMAIGVLRALGVPDRKIEATELRGVITPK